jgi:hypothetical protein
MIEKKYPMKSCKTPWLQKADLPLKVMKINEHQNPLLLSLTALLSCTTRAVRVLGTSLLSCKKGITASAYCPITGKTVLTMTGVPECYAKKKKKK